MNILMVVYRYLGQGGAEVSTKLMAEQLQKRGHRVIIASTTPYEGIETRIFKKFKNFPLVPLHASYLSRFLAKIIDEDNIDLVYSQDFLTTKGSIIAATRKALPVIVHLRDYWFACPKSTSLRLDYTQCDVCSYMDLLGCIPIYRFPWEAQKLWMIKSTWKLLDRADHIFVLDNVLVGKLRMCGVTNQNIEVVYNARDPKQFLEAKGKNAFRKKHGLRNVVITFVGSLTYVKGVTTLVKLMPRILRAREDVSFLVVGDGPMEKEIRGVVEREGLGDKVVLTGRVDLSMLPLIYHSSDIVVLPTIWNEPFGAVQIEAAMAGAPVVASNVGGVRDGMFGINLNAFDTEAWVSALNRLIDDKKFRNEIGGRGKKVVLENFGVDGYIEKIDRVISSLKRITN